MAYWAGRDADSLAALAVAEAKQRTAEPIAAGSPRTRERTDAASGEAADGRVVSDIVQLLEVVALGQAVAFLPASTSARHPRPDVVYRPVSGLSPSTVAVAWPEVSRSLTVAAFVRAASEVAARLPKWVAALI